MAKIERQDRMTQPTEDKKKKKKKVAKLTYPSQGILAHDVYPALLPAPSPPHIAFGIKITPLFVPLPSCLSLGTV